MSSYEAKCDRCSYKRKLYDILRSYDLGDGYKSAVTIRRQYAWCHQCQQTVSAELLEDLPSLEAELTQANGRGEEFYSGFAFGNTWEEEKIRYLDDLKQRISLRKARVAPPKCLDCGSPNIIGMPESDGDDDEGPIVQPIEHPGCGGTLTITSIGLALNRAWFFYTPEGDKIESQES